MSLLKVSPYDPPTMGCRGLQKYMVEVFPYGEWTHEGSRTTLTAFLRRLDKTFVKICKKPSIRVQSYEHVWNPKTAEVARFYCKFVAAYGLGSGRWSIEGNLSNAMATSTYCS